MSEIFIDTDGNAKGRVSSEIIGFPEGWVATASADNAQATATKAASSGKSHYIASVFAAYGATKTGLLRIKDGTTIIAEYYVVDSGVIVLPVPVKATSGNAVSAELLASGTAGVFGKVNISGYTK